MIGSRTQWYRSIAVVMAWREAAWRDDKKLTWGDLPETVVAGATLALIWKGDVILAAVPGLAIVEAAVIAGAVTSYAIAGEEGFDDYVDFITEPTKIPERVAFTAETIYEHKIEQPLISAASWYVDQVDTLVDKFKLAWSITRPRPILPF